MSGQERGRGAELRAERIRWRGRSRSMNERLHKMKDQGSTLDKRLGRHAEESKGWHMTWDDPQLDG